MPRILNVEGDGGHTVDKYSFKPLDLSSEEGEVFKEISFVNKTTNENVSSEESSNGVINEEPKKVETSSVPPSNNGNNELVEKLLKKIDELSTSIVKMEMQLEKQSGECEKRVQEATERALEDGYRKAEEEITQRFLKEVEEKKEILANSISKIEDVYNDFDKKIDSIEKELVSVALDIANEVISKEVSENSAKIAEAFAKELMKEVKEASKITIKVNPKDLEYLKNRIEDDKVEFIADRAISEGGIVILSDVGNIDAQIHQRFNNLKNVVLNSKE